MRDSPGWMSFLITCGGKLCSILCNGASKCGVTVWMKYCPFTMALLLVVQIYVLVPTCRNSVQRVLHALNQITNNTRKVIEIINNSSCHQAKRIITPQDPDQVPDPKRRKTDSKSDENLNQIRQNVTKFSKKVIKIFDKIQSFAFFFNVEIMFL